MFYSAHTHTHTHTHIYIYIYNIYIYSYNTHNQSVITGQHWYYISHLLSIDNTGNSSNGFYHPILSCLTHTVSTQTQNLLLQSTLFFPWYTLISLYYRFSFGKNSLIVPMYITWFYTSVNECKNITCSIFRYVFKVVECDY